MKKILLLLIILFVSVMTTACVNNFAIKELNNKAEDYLNKGDTETAICRLKSSLDLDGDVLDTHYKLAVAYNNLERYEESVEELNKVIALDSEYFPAFYTLANVKEKLAYISLYAYADENTSYHDLETENLENFGNYAQEAVDAYNQYLIRDVKATDTTEVNSKISELNAKIKEIGAICDKRRSSQTEEGTEQNEEQAAEQNIEQNVDGTEENVENNEQAPEEEVPAE